MSSHLIISRNEIRRLFTIAISEMYRNEVPQYDSLLTLVEKINSRELENKATQYSGITKKDLMLERHGAIRIGTADELFTMRRLFGVMGMLPVDYYDLSSAGIPVHSTAFRAIQPEDLQISPFRMFTSLLRLDLIEDESLKEKVSELLSTRRIFSAELLSLIDQSEKQIELKSGLTSDQATLFIAQALEVLRWHNKARVTEQEYKTLKNSHALIADIVSFKGLHINHLTPRTLDIEEVQIQLSKWAKRGCTSKQIIEGPPLRKHPILLRQTSFLALEESIEFTDEKTGKHTARFGEIEQRGIALTPKGRRLYDRLLEQAKAAKELGYSEALADAFLAFPDSHKELHAQGLAYYSYSVNTNVKIINKQSTLEQLIENGNLLISPIIYEDFLPVSAAGIFVSNLVDSVSINLERQNSKEAQQSEERTNQVLFEEALGTAVNDSFSLYKKQQQDSLKEALTKLVC